MPPHAVLATATICLTGCAGGSDAPPSTCPPVVTYSADKQQQVSDVLFYHRRVHRHPSPLLRHGCPVLGLRLGVSELQTVQC
jgi:hypothetical protein